MKRFTILLTLILPLVALISLFSLFIPSTHALEVSGPIYSDTTWTLANSPYIMKDDVTIQSGVTLTIEAGVEVIAETDEYMQVNGNLNIAGTPTATTVISNLTSIQIAGTGSATIDHARIFANSTDPLIRYGIGFYDNSNNVISITNSTIENAVHPILTDPVSIHRLQMENVTFANNVNNKVFISKPYPVTSELSQDVTLTDQPGLEGYELLDLSNLNVPQGITLTLEAGTTLINSSETFHCIDVLGHLVINGQVTNTALITGFSYIDIYNTGSANINHAHIFANNSDYRMGISIDGNSNNEVALKNSTIENAVFPIGTIVDSIHRLQMDNVAFTNNVNNKVFIAIATYPYSNELTQDVFLTAQPGLEGYELYDLTSLNVPQGVTLTLEAGATLINSSNSPQDLFISGRLLANGQITNTTTITGFSHVAFSETGSGFLSHANIYAGDIYPSFGVIFTDNSNNLISISNSIIENAIYPILTEADSIHRLQMDNVTFANNVSNRVFIFTPEGSESLSANVTLSPQPGLEGYEFPGDKPLQIPEGITMTVEPGASLLISDSGKIEVNGRLQTNGSPLNPVTFTSALDSAPGQWDGIVVEGGEVDLLHTEIRYGITNLSLISPTSTVAISHTNIISASQSGIAVQDGQLTMACSTLANNNDNGLSMDNSGSPLVVIERSEIWGNGFAGITNTHTTLSIDARFNWWGASDGPSGNYSGSGDAVLGRVNFAPWLIASPDCSQPIKPINQLFLPMVVNP